MNMIMETVWDAKGRLHKWIICISMTKVTVCSDSVSDDKKELKIKLESPWACLTLSLRWCSAASMFSGSSKFNRSCSRVKERRHEEKTHTYREGKKNPAKLRHCENESWNSDWSWPEHFKSLIILLQNFSGLYQCGIISLIKKAAEGDIAHFSTIYLLQCHPGLGTAANKTA